MTKIVRDLVKAGAKEIGKKAMRRPHKYIITPQTTDMAYYRIHIKFFDWIGVSGDARVLLKVVGGFAAIGLAAYGGKKYFDYMKETRTHEKMKNIDRKYSSASTSPVQAEPSVNSTAEEVDPEKDAKEKDRRVKNLISQELGLYENSIEQSEELVTEKERAQYDANPRNLVGSLVKRGDTVVLVSPPGIGKSILGVQIGLSISEGRTPEFLEDGADHQNPQFVLLYDAESETDDRVSRYGNYCTANTFRVFKGYHVHTCYHLLKDLYERSKNFIGDTTIILDNVFALIDSMSQDESRLFLLGLKTIKTRLYEQGIGLTIVLISHTVKDVQGVPDLKDVAGSVNIQRFATSILSLAELPDGTVALVPNKKRKEADKDCYIMKRSSEPYLHFDYVNKVSKVDVEKTFKNKNTSTVSAQSSTSASPTGPTKAGSLTVAEARAMKTDKDSGMTDVDCAKKYHLNYPIYVGRELQYLEDYDKALAQQGTNP